jgi:hypothetical protein
LLAAGCWSCAQKAETEKHQHKRDHIINVREQVREIRIDDVLIGDYALLNLIGDYLIISDMNSPDQLIHILDRNSFRYVTSAIYKGQGPGEIVNMGHLIVDEANRRFYIFDHGKQRLFGYYLDSLLANPFHMPDETVQINERTFPHACCYVNDTLCIGVIIKVLGNSDYKPSVGKWNMTTGEIRLMKYEHPKIEKKRTSCAISVEHGIYVECYSYHDLMTICDLDGNLQHNIYGRKWNSEKSNKTSHYGPVAFCGDQIFALYTGKDTFHHDEKRGMVSTRPTQFLVFSINGDYIRTLETGYPINRFCYDRENNRIIMNLDDEIQFACLDLDICSVPGT